LEKTMTDAFTGRQGETLEWIAKEGLFKAEQIIAGPQGGRIDVLVDGRRRTLVNLCANNYLGLANHPEVIAAARNALDVFGFGMASVRFICGTQSLHRALEQSIARFLSKDDAILFAGCFDANGGVFEALLGEGDAIISDSLNHASIIDGIRLTKTKRYRYANGDMNDLESKLKEAVKDNTRLRLIATDGVFSMDGYVANLPEICRLANAYDAVVLVDDCHATGHIGREGRGTPTLTGVEGAVQIITGTLGKTLGGAMGGFVAASQPIVDVLRQKARPYLFSNSLAPAIAAGSLSAIEIARGADDLRAKLEAHSTRFRTELKNMGFELLEGSTPIVPVMLGDARRAQAMAAALNQRGVHVAAFSYPVVPSGKARIRTQLSAAHTYADIDLAINAFREAGRSLGII
jgi:glycine C-acetyltransferase